MFASSFLDTLPQLVLERLESLPYGKKPRIEFKVSPVHVEEIGFETILDSVLCVGSGKFNAYSYHYFQQAPRRPRLTIQHEESKDKWLVRESSDGPLLFETIPAEDTRLESEFQINELPNTLNVGILVKHKDVSRNIIVFLAAGSGINGTRATIDFLVRHWSMLYSHFGESEFGIVLKCPKVSDDPSGYLNWDFIWPTDFVERFYSYARGQSGPGQATV